MLPVGRPRRRRGPRRAVSLNRIRGRDPPMPSVVGHSPMIAGRTDVPIEVTMPKLSPTMETGVIAQWLVKVGDQVKEGDVAGRHRDRQGHDADEVVRRRHDRAHRPCRRRRGRAGPAGDGPGQEGRRPQEGRRQSLAAGPGAGAGAGRKPAGRGRGGARRRGGDRPATATTAGNGQQAAGRRSTQPAGGRLKASPLARKVAASSQVELGQVRGIGPRRPDHPPRRRGLSPGRARRRGEPRRPRRAKPAAAARGETGRRAPATGPAPAATAHSPHADAQDDRPAHAPGQAGRSRDPPDRRRPRRPAGGRPRGAQQATCPRGDQALARRLRHQGRRPGAAASSRRERQLRARRDRPPRRGQYRDRRRARRGPDRPGAAQCRHPRPARDPRPERGAGRRGARRTPSPASS